jgi:V8-like Glu-specific endopeptidase
MTAPEAADRWRKLLQIRQHPAGRGLPPGGGLESIALPDDPTERVHRAKEAMVRLVKDRFGGDSALLKSVNELALSGEDAIAILDASPHSAPSSDQFAALEAIVLFDGTRPSFLVKDHQIDFSSSFNTGTWQIDLKPCLDRVQSAMSCIGRVELGERHIGTAFLVTPTLAITNRHVAQSIARFEANRITLKAEVYLDFGREEWNGKASFDRRRVEAVLFAGNAVIAAPIDHNKLDLAVLRVTASGLDGGMRNRCLLISQLSQGDYLGSSRVAAAGYPANPDLYVPSELKSKYEQVLKRLLEGEGGAKRFAPGVPSDTAGSGVAAWTLCHDATTINGNSGSPLFVLGNAATPQDALLTGLHYGGDWGGERTNWAHRLAATGASLGYGQAKTFTEFCQAEGIKL